MNCLICGQKGVVKYRNLKDNLIKTPFSYNINWCKHDNILWENSFLTELDYLHIYKNYHAYKKTTNKKLFVRLFDFFNFNIVNFISKEKNKKILDFGCGGGDLISVFLQRGYNIFGIEKNVDLVSFLKKEFGEERIRDFNNFYELEESSFDIIILNHVIEHLDNPIVVLKKLSFLLKESGVIFISTPNIDSFGHFLFRNHWRGLEVPRHRFIFSEKSLKSVLAKSDLKVERQFYPVGLARGMFTSSMFSLFGNKENNFLKYLFHSVGFLFMLVEFFW